MGTECLGFGAVLAGLSGFPCFFTVGILNFRAGMGKLGA